MFILYFYYLLMTEKISYSFNDKFFSLENEKRIGRRQFLGRVFVPGIILSIPAIILTALFPSYSIYIQIVYSLYWLLCIWILLPKVIIKRCHDFNSEWIIEKNLLLWIYSIYTIIWIIIYLSIAHINTISPAWMWLLWQWYEYLGFASFLIIIYLCVKPWTKWKNNYWDDTSNVKLGLLG